MSKSTEKYRLARNLKEGYEVQGRDDVWHRVEHVMVIHAPLKVVSIRLDNDVRVGMGHNDKVMSRIPVVDNA